MYRIIDERASGKTSRLLLLAKDYNGVVVCSNPKAMQEKAYAYGIVGITYIDYNTFVNMTQAERKNVGRVFIDELEVFLSNYCSLMGYTISKE